jgi:hypothetical protein
MASSIYDCQVLWPFAHQYQTAECVWHVCTNEGLQLDQLDSTFFIAYQNYILDKRWCALAECSNVCSIPKEKILF